MNQMKTIIESKLRAPSNGVKVKHRVVVVDQSSTVMFNFVWCDNCLRFIYSLCLSKFGVIVPD